MRGLSKRKIDNKKELRIVIPVRIDSFERLRNLKLVLHNFLVMDIPVTILEADRRPHCSALLSSFDFDYKFVEDTNEMFHRTRYLNQLLHICTVPVVGVWDTDVILSESQIEESLNAVLVENYVFSSPYNGYFHFLTAQQSMTYVANPDYSFLQSFFPHDIPFCRRASWGGAFLVNRESYLRCGGENEHFYGWGPEDVERVHRLEILGYSVHRVESEPLYHLWHSRGANSFASNADRAFRNRAELVKICSITRNELEQEVKTWQ